VYDDQERRDRKMGNWTSAFAGGSALVPPVLLVIVPAQARHRACLLPQLQSKRLLVQQRRADSEFVHVSHDLSLSSLCAGTGVECCFFLLASSVYYFLSPVRTVCAAYKR
jgi:hypothetical protein